MRASTKKRGLLPMEHLLLHHVVMLLLLLLHHLSKSWMHKGRLKWRIRSLMRAHPLAELPFVIGTRSREGMHWIRHCGRLLRMGTFLVMLLLLPAGILTRCECIIWQFWITHRLAGLFRGVRLCHLVAGWNRGRALWKGLGTRSTQTRLWTLVARR